MNQTLIENVKLAIIQNFKIGFYFKMAVIVFNDWQDQNVRTEAIKIISKFGAVCIGSPAGNFGVTTLKKAEGWSISGHYYGMYTYVHPSEINKSHFNETEIGYLVYPKEI